MKKHGLFKVVTLSALALVCMSGQVPRKELQSEQSTQIKVKQHETKNENSEKEVVRKSAASKVMEASSVTKIERKSAAQKAMEKETLQFPL